MIPKFRAYIIDSSSPINNRMVNFDEFEIINFQSKFLTFSTGLWSLDSLSLMQYTGLQDRNGKDIYEGDIVKWFHTYKENHKDYLNIIGCVVYSCGAFGISRDKSSQWDDSLHDYLCNGDFEVIGNIYENPELLNENEVDNEA